MPSFPTQGDTTTRNSWGTALRSFFSTFFNLDTGTFVAGSISHTELADKGANTHTAVDSFIASKAQASGVASLDSGSLVVQDPANAVTASTANKIVKRDSSGNVTGKQLVADIANGTAPLVVTSATKVVNLNVEKVDGYDLDQSVSTTGSPSFVTITSTQATGTAPLTVTSTTKVTNLNADKIDDKEAADLPGANVWDYTVAGAAIQTATKTGLSGASHGGYEFDFELYNPTGGAVAYAIYLNGDWTVTNYWRWGLFGGGVGAPTSITSTNNNTIFASVAAGVTVRVFGVINASKSISRLEVNMRQINSVTGLTQLQDLAKTAADITSVDVYCGTAGGIGIGSTFRMWRRM